MARDYKPRRKKPMTAPGRAGMPVWLVFVCGLGLGLAIAAVVYLKDHKLDAPQSNAGRPAKRKLRNTETPDLADTEEPPKVYDFYDQLPKFEVVVPEKEKDVHPDIRYVPETRRGTYVLQAGSYKEYADADRVRAKLALQGMEAKVQKVSVDRDSWYRIRIGPIAKLDDLNRMRQVLRKADVDVLVIRVGD
jgi:cell division protein FtsN